MRRRLSAPPAPDNWKCGCLGGRRLPPFQNPLPADVLPPSRWLRGVAGAAAAMPIVDAAATVGRQRQRQRVLSFSLAGQCTQRGHLYCRGGDRWRLFPLRLAGGDTVTAMYLAF